MMKLTQEEKSIVVYYLNCDPTIWGMIKIYWPILLPTVILELYSLLSNDIFAASLAFLVLIGFMVWFFVEAGKSSKLLQKALVKYESESSALDQ